MDDNPNAVDADNSSISRPSTGSNSLPPATETPKADPPLFTLAMYYTEHDSESRRPSPTLKFDSVNSPSVLKPPPTPASKISTASPDRPKSNIFVTRPPSAVSRLSHVTANATINTTTFKVPNLDAKNVFSGEGDRKEPPDRKATDLVAYKRDVARVLDLRATEAARVDHSSSTEQDKDKPMEILVQPSTDTQRQHKSSVEEAKHVEIPLDNLQKDDRTEPKPESSTENSDQTKMKENGAGEARGKRETHKHSHSHSHGHGLDSAHFEDGKRQIDFVLVYVTGHLKKPDLSRAGKVVEKEKQRLYFEENLRKDGLELEEDVHVHELPGETITFVKVHAPWNVMCRQAEILKMKQPTRLNDPYADAPHSDGPSTFVRVFHSLKKAAATKLAGVGVGLSATASPSVVDASTPITPAAANNTCITWPFSRKHIELFSVDDTKTFFWPSRRHEMVWEVLQNAHNDPDDEKKRGIESLLEKGVYESAFPLHDGPYDCSPEQKPNERCERQILKQTWADWRCVFDPQPLSLIRKYYGEKVGFYFAFLGFYVKMLIFPSVFGLITFLYGMLYTGDDVILTDICNQNDTPGTYVMCPLCQPPYCKFTQLYEACMNATWDYRLDNEATVAMAILTVVWATIMLKLWKRRQAELAFEWDTYDVKIEDCVVRPEFEERAPVKRRNPVTREMEPYVPKTTKLLWLTASTSVTIFMLCLVGAALAALVIARVSLYKTFHYLGFHDNVELSRWAVHGLIFLVVLIFEKTYSILAHKLTSLECPRTQQEWLSSYLWKVFIFALLNDFVPLGYAAWVKGRLTNTPLDLNWHSELCDTGGCMSEVTELISVLLLCRLVIGNITEIGVPILQTTWNRLTEELKIKTVIARFFGRLFKKKPPKTGSKKKSKRVLERHDAQWHRDFHLAELEEDAVSPEYLEMIVQFAFVTLFIPSMPLAPLVCLINNVIEIRIDSAKFITAHRRPLPVRAPGSQIWNDFLNVICKLAVVCNAGLISFTSNVLPRLYYKFAKQPDHTYEGFVSITLSKLHHKHFQGDEEREKAFFEANVTDCYYEDYREEESPFKRTEMWWELYCIRLAAFAVFLVLSFTFQWLFNFVVSDVPAHVNLKILRRRYVVTKAMEAMAGADAFKHRRALAKSDMSRSSDQDPHSAAGPSASRAGFVDRDGSAAARRRKAGVRRDSLFVHSVLDDDRHDVATEP